MGIMESITTTAGLHSESIKCLVYGKAGVGKTSLLGTGDNEKTLILSAESGLLSLSDKSIDVLVIRAWPDLAAIYKELESGSTKYTTICIDSLTEVSDMLVQFLQKSSDFQDPKNALKMWGEYNKKMVSIVKAFRDLKGFNVVFTALAEDVNDGGMLIKKPLIQGSKAQSLLTSFFDEVLYLAINESTGEREIHTQPTNYYDAKDRSGKLDRIEVTDLTALFNKIKG
jgi:phage nucleotide-binding protein